jgi:mannose-6-phosphate isomerase-like protein (cupin superfamily)
MKTSRDQAEHKHKYGKDLWVYPEISSAAKLVYIDAKEGHFEEFYDKVSTFTYYVIEGSGTFFLNGEPQPAVAGDLITIPPNTKIYYLGRLKMILVTTPAWRAENEMHVRDIPKE